MSSVYQPASESGDSTFGMPPDGHVRYYGLLAILLVFAVWLLTRLLFWVGFAGADDLYYARYAHLFHRLPMNHMEFRMPVVLSIRPAMLLFGPSEAAACVAPMLCSAGVLAAVAWFVGWPRRMTWETTGSVLLASMLPIDVTFASYPSPAAVSAATTALGMTCILKGGWRLGLLGALLLALAFMGHFLNFFFVGLFCLTALAFDWRKYWRPVLACICFSGGLLAAEMAAYGYLAGNPMLRFDSLSGISTGVPDDGRAGGSTVKFFLLPLKILIFSKPFSFGLLLLLVCGAASYRSLNTEQRIIWVTTIGFWFWLGYGTVTPFGYRPATRGMHYYTPLVFGICALAPSALAIMFANRRRLAQAVLALLLLSCPALLAAGGGWGRQVDVSRDLLRYAQAHPGQRFLIDAHAFNEMYALNGFAMPANVMVLDSPAQAFQLLANREPEPREVISFPDAEKADAILVNRSRDAPPPEDEFVQFLKQHRGRQIHEIEPSHRLLFAPLAPWIGDRGFALRDQGGEVIRRE